MTYQEFLREIQTQLQQTFGTGAQVSLKSIVKNNGINYDGLIVIRPGCNISPTIYLNAYYHRYLSGVGIDEICRDILSTYQKRLPSDNFDTDFYLDYNRVHPRIVPKLINYEKNLTQLSSVPHKRFLDLAVVFLCLVNTSPSEQATILIRKEHLAHWDASEEDLFQAAIFNAPFLLPYHLRLITDYIELLEPESSQMSQIPYILTNQHGINGAATLLYPNLLQTISKQLSADLVILPSSVHEVLLLPFQSGELKPDMLSAYPSMVQEVNETQVLDDEILSDHAYLFRRSSDVPEII